MRPLFAACLLLLGAAACGRREDPAVKLEFDRRMALALDAMRRDLPESAAAELERCARLRPGDPEAGFQLERLRLMPEGRDAGEAAAWRARREEKIRRLGPIGEVELAALAAVTAEDIPEGIPVPADLAGAPDVKELVSAMGSIRESMDAGPGAYDPDRGVPRLLALFDRRRDLAALRLYFARDVIDGWVRVGNLDRPDKPYWSSSVILAIVLDQLDKASDRLDPRSPAALHALVLRAEALMRMGDLDDAIALYEVALRRAPGPLRRELQGHQALCLMKKGRPKEASRLLALSLKDGEAGFGKYHRHLWLLRLAQESAGIPAAARRPAFRLRPGIETDPARSPLSYADVGAAHGLDKLLGLGPAAWGDYDGDGDDDLFLSGLDTYGSLLRNDGGVFTDVSREAGLENVRSGFSATFSDYDNDGHPDLYIGRLGWSGPAPNSLYRNRGDGTFADVTERSGLGDPGSSFVHVWADVDRDGFLDLFVANGCTGYGDTNKLYRNNGDGTFADVTLKAGLQEPAGTRTVGAVFGDYDGDGWPDLFLPGYNAANRLYRNRGGGAFEEVAAKAGVQDLDHAAEAFLGFFLDYDNDGDLDILRTTDTRWEDSVLALSASWDALPEEKKKDLRRSTTRLYRNGGDGTFTDASDAAGFRHPMAVMGAMVGDLDNDGFVDAYFATGTPELIHLEPDRFFRNDGRGGFGDLTFASGLGNVGKGHGTTFVDLDGDGELEIFVNEGGFVMGDPYPTAYYRNRKPTRNHWLRVDLRGMKSNRDATGARLLLSSGGLRQLREAVNGEGFGSSNPRALHFGLGRNERVDRLEIRWPSGLTQVFTDLKADQRIFVKEGETWTKVNAPRREKRR